MQQSRSEDIAIGPARKAEIPQIKTWFAETLAEHQARHPYGFATNTMEIWSILIDAVREGNAAGAALFRKAGFTPMTTTYRAGPIRPARAIHIPKRWKYRKWLGPVVLIAGAVVLWMVLFLRERMGG